MHWLAGILMAAVCAEPAAAASTSCQGKVKGDAGRMQVDIDFDGSKETGRTASWFPIDDKRSAVPALILDYDLQGQAIAPLRGVTVLAIAKTEPLPKSLTATVTVRTAGGFWTRPWRLYATQRQEVDTAASRPVMFMGSIPVALSNTAMGRALNIDLLGSIGAQHPVEVEVRGDANEVFSAAT